MYIFDHGETANQFAAALAERARGPASRCGILVDGFGSSLGPLEAQMLSAAGARVRVYKPLKVYSIDRVGHRTHRRILTVDGRLGFCGGVGIDDRWKGDARDPSEWRDTMVEVEGPVVAQLQHIFAQDWVHTTGEVLNGDRQFPQIEPAGDDARAGDRGLARRRDLDVEAAALHGHPGGAPEHLDRERVLRARPRRSARAWWRRRGAASTCGSSSRGSTSTSPTCAPASHYHYGELLEGGVGIYEYRPTMMHNKVMAVDGIWSTIGSINFVNRSMTKNAEVNVAVYDRGFAARVEAMFLADLARCDVLTREHWRHRGLLDRIGRVLLLALLGELLARSAPAIRGAGGVGSGAMLETLLTLERPLVVFDTETTGTNSRSDRIVEIACVKVHPDGRAASSGSGASTRAFRSRRARPRFTASRTPTSPRSRASATARPSSRRFSRAAIWPATTSSGFDLPVLRAEFLRAGVPFEIAERRIVDAQRIFFSREPRHLSAAARFYCQSEHEGAHGALADADMTLRVLVGQLERYAELPAVRRASCTSSSAPGSTRTSTPRGASAWSTASRP